MLGNIIGIGATVALWPTIKGNPEFDQVVEQLPASVRAMIGSQADIALTSAPGYLQARLFSTLLPVLLLVYAISLGAGAIGGTEEDGTLQLVVAAPVTRRRIAIERLAASAGLVIALAAISAATTIALSAPTGLLDTASAPRIALAMWAVIGIALFHGAIAFTVGAATGRRGPAVASATGVAFGGYILHAITASTPAIEALRVLSPWWWLLDRNLLVQDATPLAVAVPGVGAALLSAVGVAIFKRRDLRLP